MTASGPLSGVTVVDLTRVLAGPFSTMILSDLGARVIKVETPGTGDDAREYGPFVNGKSAYFISINRRSEEHTSELQSLMRISYAVFCLKKKTTNKNTHIT